jgi:hypothetical protein
MTSGARPAQRRLVSNAATGPEADRLRLELNAMLRPLIDQCWRGWLYLREWRVLDERLRVHPILRSADPALFSLALAAFADQSMLMLARLIDRHKAVASVHWVIDFSEQHKNIFPHRSDVLAQGIADDRRKLAELRMKMADLKRLRDNYYAHLNRKALTSLDTLFAECSFDFEDAGKLYSTVGTMLNRYSGHLSDSTTLIDRVAGEGHTSWLLSFLGKCLEAANMKTAQCSDLERMLNELFGGRFHQREISVRKRQRPPG